MVDGGWSFAGSLVRWRLMAQRLLRALVDFVGVAGSPVLLSRWCIGGGALGQLARDQGSSERGEGGWKAPRSGGLSRASRAAGRARERGIVGV